MLNYLYIQIALLVNATMNRHLVSEENLMKPQAHQRNRRQKLLRRCKPRTRAKAVNINDDSAEKRRRTKSAKNHAIDDPGAGPSNNGGHDDTLQLN
jgi:hypothetical protein